MKPLLFIGLVAIMLNACGLSSEELDFQTQDASTATVARWTETPSPTVSLKSSETPSATATLLPTVTPTETMLPTSTPTETPYPELNIADKPEYPTGVSSDDPWSVLQFIADTVALIHLECFLKTLDRSITPKPDMCPFDHAQPEMIALTYENQEYYKYLFCVYGQDTNVYSIEYKDTYIIHRVGDTPILYTRYDRRYTYQEYQELIFLQDCRDIIADWEAAHD